uniref:Uncharacterized protein n=1 Tax=Arundo donax TaxID=35708 RepID=A0A0A9CLN1_ARUDO
MSFVLAAHQQELLPSISGIEVMEKKKRGNTPAGKNLIRKAKGIPPTSSRETTGKNLVGVAEEQIATARTTTNCKPSRGNSILELKNPRSTLLLHNGRVPRLARHCGPVGGRREGPESARNGSLFEISFNCRGERGYV